MRAEVPQNESRGRRVEIVLNKRAGDFIGEMSHAPHNALLDGPRIGADFKHVEIVVRFEQQNIRAVQMEANGIRHVSEVGGDGDLNALRAEREADGIDRVVEES